MDLIPIDIISNEIFMFLDERSLMLFSMTNKNIMFHFKNSKWSLELCIKLIIYVINNDELIEKIKNILIPITFKCNTIDFWPPKLCEILKKNNRLNLLNWVKKSGCPNYIYCSNYHRCYDDYYDEYNESWCDYLDDIWFDQNELKKDQDDEEENVLYIKECKKKNRQIDFNEIYEDEINYCDNDNEIYDDEYDDISYETNNNYIVNINKNIKFIGISTLGDYFPISLR